MEQGVSLLLGGWILGHYISWNVEHLENSVGECGLDLRQERDPSVSPEDLHTVCGSKESKVCSRSRVRFIS